MRAGTLTLSDAVIHTISGTRHGYERHSAVGDVVRGVISAAGRLRARKSSGGLLENEYTSANHCSSGDSTVWWEPAVVVSRSRVPPVTAMRYNCVSNGEFSLVVR